MNSHASQRGFTFIEILIAVGITGMISTLVVQAFMTSVRSNVSVETKKNLKQSGDHALQSLTRPMQNAETITACTGSSVSFSTFDLSANFSTDYTASCQEKSVTIGGDPYTVRQLQLANITAGTAEFLTSDNITLANCGVFTCEMTGTTYNNIRITYTLTSLTNTDSVSFNAFVRPRNVQD